MSENKKLKEVLEEECAEKCKEKANLELFAEGYKAGFKDGYMAAWLEVSQMTPEAKKKLIEEGAQLGWPHW